MVRKMRSGLLIVVLVSAFVMFSGCTGGGPSPPPEFGIKDVSVSQHRASIDDTIEFSWNYDQPEKLKKQWVELDSLTIRGKLFRLIEGCSPEQPNQPCMSVDVRAKSFGFTGPVTVVIVGQSNDNKIVKQERDLARLQFGPEIQRQGGYQHGEHARLEYSITLSPFDRS